MVCRHLLWFTQKELQVEHLRFLFQLVDKLVVGFSERRKEVSMATLARFRQVPNILGVCRLI
jgi:hypothetical protein